MYVGADRSGGWQVLLTVACGITLQLGLIRDAVLLGEWSAAFPTFAAHLAGWGAGLGLHRSGSPRRGSAALLAAAAGGTTWLGVAAVGIGLAPPGSARFLPVALVSGGLTGASIAAALTGCRGALPALIADLAGVGLGAISHVLLSAALPGLPGAGLWLVLLALSTLRRSLPVALVAAAIGVGVLVPLDRPSRLARAETPLGRVLRQQGLEAWGGAFRDLDGRVDAVVEPEGGGVALYINGATQAQTPRAVDDRTTVGILELLRPRTALVLGAGGMVDVATLLAMGVEHVVAVERSEAVLRAAAKSSAAARRILEDPRVGVVRGEGRRYVSTAAERFDLVFLPLAYAGAGVSPGALTMLPSYLFTLEGMRALAARAQPSGAVCIVLPTAELRDRVLATLGRIAARAESRQSLLQRLWVAQSGTESAYAEAVCWAPHRALPQAAPMPRLRVLHAPGWPAAAALRHRLDGRATPPPASDHRPYFFDLSTLHPASPSVAAAVWVLVPWSLLSVVISGVVALRRRAPNSPARAHLVIAWLTGFAFSALEYLVLSLGRASGLVEGVAYAVAASVFAVTGAIGARLGGSVEVRALCAAVALGGMFLLAREGVVTHLFTLSGPVSLRLGMLLICLAMGTGVSVFAGLFRAASRAGAGGSEVRPLFVASALGTLAATAPVLGAELRWGTPGSAVIAAGAYGAAFVVAVASRSSAKDAA